MDRFKDECCICYEKNLAQRLKDGTFNCVQMSCCGSLYCKTNCRTKYEQIKAETGKDYDCPICRTPFAETPKEEFDRCMSHAKIGRGWALEIVGQFYYQGYGVSQSDKKAFEFCSLAAEKGEANAQHWVGQMYEEGKGVKQSYEKDFHFYSQAADQGLPISQSNLALYYLIGRGIEKSIENAVKWYTLAADNGLKESQYNLAVCYTMEDGVEQNYEKAVHYYTLAAEQDHKKSQFNLAILYGKGDGVKQSDVKSIYWFRQCVKENEDKEQCVKAKELIDRILSFSSFVCVWCLKGRETKLTSLCSKCKSIYYCDRNCQAKHWKAEGNSHKMECKEP